jgi:translation elongation factor EF-G
VRLPLSVLVTRRGEESQRGFAHEASTRVQFAPPTQGEVTDGGLLIRGVTEIDLETAFDSLRQAFPGVKAHSPSVEFIYGDRPLEPYYLVTVTTGNKSIGDVLGDLSARRGSILSVGDRGSDREVKAEVPVIECFGYSTVLRVLTRKQGSYHFQFIGYRLSSGPPHGAPTTVA